MQFDKPAGFGGKFRLHPEDCINTSPLLDAVAYQLMKEREGACYEDIAAAIRKHYPGNNCTGAMVAGRINELLTAEENLCSRLTNFSDCNECEWRPGCMHYKSTVCRVNCPLWRPKV